MARLIRVALSGWGLRVRVLLELADVLGLTLAALNMVLQDVVSVESLPAFRTLVGPKIKTRLISSILRE